MPQVDHLVSACAGGVSDSKIACETLADHDPPPSDHPDFPPESFFLSKEDEIDWIDRNAFIERKDSGKGTSLHSVNLKSNSNFPNSSSQASNSGSQRYSQSVKSKPSIIGLPKTQKATYTDAKHRRPASIRLFPKRSQSSASSSGRKSAVPLTEPSSPKVSCMGRVRSSRDRSRQKKIRQKQHEPAISRSRSKRHKTGFWSTFRSIFRSKGHKQVKQDEPGSGLPPVPAVGAPKKSRSVKRRDSASSSSPADPPNLGVVQRFSSGRRSDAWAADLEVDDAKSEPLDHSTT